MTTTTKTMMVVMIMMMTLATLIYPRQCIYRYQRLLWSTKYREKLIQMNYNGTTGRRIGYVHASVEFGSTEIKLQLVVREGLGRDLGLLMRCMH